MSILQRKTLSRSALRARIMIPVIGLMVLFSASSLTAATRWAVVIGTNYKGNTADIPPLDLCERDAKLFKDTLKKYGHYDQVDVILGKKVSAAILKKTLKKIARKAGKKDTVVLYFAGHGTYSRDAKSPNGMKNIIVMPERPHVSDDTLNVWIKSIKTKKLVFVFDCCFSGGIAKKGRNSRGSGKIPMDDKKGKVIENGGDDFYFDNKGIVASTEPNQTAIEIGGKINHGIFTYYFAQGMLPKNGDLNRDKVVTALEAFEWSARRITEKAKTFNHNQSPMISGDVNGIELTGRRDPKPPKPVKPTPVKPIKPVDEPKPIPVKPIPTPTKPVIPVTPVEPPVVDHNVKRDVKIFTTIFKSRKGGVVSMKPADIIRFNRLAKKTRKVKVLVSGKAFNFKVKWLSRRQLKRYSGENIRLGDYSVYGRVYKNKVAMITIKDVPTGVHEVQIHADDYPIIRHRIGVQKTKRYNKAFIVASLAGYGTIRGKVFYKTFDKPYAGKSIWMPTIKSPNLDFKRRTLRDGSFWFINLPPANDYFIKASFAEAIPLDNKQLTVRSGQTTRVDIILNTKFGF